MSAFTPEQREEIARIVGRVLAAVEKRRGVAGINELLDHVDWAAHEERSRSDD